MKYNHKYAQFEVINWRKNCVKVIKSGLSEGRRGGCIGCCETNMAGLAAVPALLVDPPETIQQTTGAEGAGGRTSAIQNGRLLADLSTPPNSPIFSTYARIYYDSYRFNFK